MTTGARRKDMPKNAVTLFPRVHRVFSNLKTWLAGTHHGVGEQHLQHYLNEYVFRFNRPTRSDGSLSVAPRTRQPAPTDHLPHVV